ncbi:MAG TPA: tetratricopeptide repeat protein [Anaerolineaceae bacterium]|nr:tetratricopeptide repeat protein [Anaerolineaceae bacterium]
METRERAQLIALLVLPVVLLVGLSVAPSPAAVPEAWDQVRLAEAHNRPAAAAGHLERVLVWQPWRADLWEQAAQARYAAGEIDAAIAAFEWAQSENALSIEGQFTLAAALEQSERVDDAHSVWMAIAHRPDLEGEQLERLTLELAAFDPVAAQATCQRWLEQEPGNGEVHYRLGLFEIVSDPEQGLARLTRAANLQSGYRPALEAVATVIEENQAADEPIRLVALGRVLGRLNEWPAAESAFARAVAAAPGWSDGWAFWGEAKQNLGQGGLAELEQAVALDPDSVIARAMLALYWRRQEQPAKGLDHLHAAAALEPEKAVWQLELAKTYQLAGDLQHAAEHYQKAIELEPQNPLTWQALAAFSAQNQLDIHGTALPAARQAYLLDTDDPVGLDLLGWIFYLLEDFDSAERFLQQALQQAPDLASAHLHRAEVLIAQHKTAQANEHLAEAIRLDGDAAVGQIARRLLEQSKRP